MATLNVARKDDVRIGTENLPIVHMTQGPVLISLVLQRFERAGRVVRVLGDPRKICMQHPDIEEPGSRRRILSSKILGNFGSGKTLAMQCHTQFFIRKCLGLAGAKNVNVAGRTELFTQLASGIMISVNEVDVYANIFQAGHLLVEK